ncbi:serine hydrolase [Anabaena cylindrica UHCC 0172]|uniref:serine hydrolase n=1 Tax=Anabaena cylindrica TaxID=1165 RepID=UPI002B220A57|nr:serine hydrolase [Anabaena cylindrica]MEA5550421.1 serine hydrolase [Anabaena cylindrica UHCC 0172]
MQLTHKTTILKTSWFLSSFLSVLLFGSTVKAANIASWYFDSNRNHLKFATNEQVQPQVKLANPNHLVIDLPGVTLGYSPVTQRVGKILREVKIAEVSRGNTRIVVTLAPGYTFDPTQIKLQQESDNHWSVELPKPVKQNLGRLNRSKIQFSPTVKKPVNLSPRLPKTITRLNTAPIQASPNLSGSKLFAGVVPLNSPMRDLEPQIKALMNRYSFLQTGMFFLDLDNGNYLDIGGDRIFPAASTIKLPILLAFFQELDAGRVSLNDTLTMRRDLVTSGSGVMQYERVGKKYTALETITKMIVISDNTATNMIIDRLGGAARLNGRFRSWGLKNTVIRHLLGDFKGTNTTSSEDMARALALLVNDKLVSRQSKEQALDILRHTKTRTLLPAGLGKGATIAHKTGDIGFLIGNAGFVTMPNGKHYLAAIFVKRPYNDVRGRKFIQEISRLVYDYLNQENPVAAIDSPQNFTR